MTKYKIPVKQYPILQLKINNFEKKKRPTHKQINKLYDIEKAFEWSKWIDEIPYIKWPKNWYVKAIPPVGNGIIRYFIKRNKNHVSVYLDCYSILGCNPEPYWEIYPINGDTARCSINNTNELLYLIKQSLAEVR